MSLSHKLIIADSSNPDISRTGSSSSKNISLQYQYKIQVPLYDRRKSQKKKKKWKRHWRNREIRTFCDPELWSLLLLRLEDAVPHVCRWGWWLVPRGHVLHSLSERRWVYTDPDILFLVLSPLCLWDGSQMSEWRLRGLNHQPAQLNLWPYFILN